MASTSGATIALSAQESKCQGTSPATMLALPPPPIRPPAAELNATFTELGERFSLAPGIVTWFTSQDGLHATSIQDFAHLASQESDLDPIPELAGVPEAQRLVQRSRIKQAWTAVRKQVQLTERTLAAEEDPDLDKLLPEATLRSQADAFFVRYHLSYPPEEAPADALVSRITREMAKRQLTVKDLNKIKTQAVSARADQKKVQIGGGLQLLGSELGGEQFVASVSDVAGLCRRAKILMRAMAIAGSGPVAQADGQAAPGAEVRGSESTNYVEFPLDLGMRVCWRMEARAALLPYRAAFQWAAKQFEEEQRAWVDRYRNSTLSIGKVVLEVFHRREALWEAPSMQVWSEGMAGPISTPPKGPPRNRIFPAGPYGAKGQGHQGFQGKGPKGGGKSKDKGSYAHKTAAGEPICGRYNWQSCTNANCKEKHVCMVKGCFQNHPARSHVWTQKGKGGKGR